MRILFVSSNRIGDAVLSTGLLAHLLRTYPEARFTIACGLVSEGVFARMPQLDRLIAFDKRPYGMHWLPLWANTVGTLWDLVVDLRASALGWLVPTRKRVRMRKGTGHKTRQIAALMGLSPPPMPTAWTNAADDAVALPDGVDAAGLAQVDPAPEVGAAAERQFHDAHADANVAHGQTPLNTGGRFSASAVSASRKSPVRPARAMP